MLYIFPVALAFAEDAPQSSGPNLLGLAPLVILFIIFYFLLIRPQQKKAREHKEMLSKVAAGDNVVTTGGIYGKVASVAEDTVTLEIAANVRVKVSKDAVAARKP